MRLEAFNALDEESAVRELRRCCGSTRWVDAMIRARPFPSAEAMADTADSIWTSLDAADWLEPYRKLWERRLDNLDRHLAKKKRGER